MSFLELENIDVSYDKKNKILEDLNLSIDNGEFVSLLGPSGCGKTTTLRVIAGFIEPMSGRFVLDGKDYTNIPVHKRNFGMVFQSYALFPHLNVFDNVAFGLKRRKEKKSEIMEKVNKILKTVDLENLSKRYPKELSGGQRQRVAIARSLIMEPSLLLLDEPLSNLDAKLRLKMRVEIKKLQRKMGITTIFVTHDQEECFSISDKVAVMNGGLIEQYDTPEMIYNYPSTEFVARFVGFENFIDFSRVNEKTFKSSDGSQFEVTTSKENCRDKGIKGTIRPDDIQVADESSNQNTIEGRIEIRTFLGKDYQYNIDTALGALVVNIGSDRIFKPGENIKLHLPTNKIILV